MRIDLFANDGSPMRITPPDIYGRGVGGAELAMMSWAEAMARRGHSIRVYNDPAAPGEYGGVEYLNCNRFERYSARDVFITYRSPNPHLRDVNAEVKLFWSCDQYTTGHFTYDVFPFVDRTVCISPYHVAYHRGHYGIAKERIGYFDLGVRLDDYNQPAKRIPGRCIFCSVPDRGLAILRQVWPEIKRQRPDASLVITSDYRLWGAPGPNNHHHRMDWLRQPDVIFLGRIDRAQLCREQLAAQVQSYPCVYEELFCISAAECQVAGVIPVTPTIGALETTNQWGVLIEDNPLMGTWQQAFVEAVIKAMDVPEQARQRMSEQARRRFDWDTICGQWEHLIESGEYVAEAVLA